MSTERNCKFRSAQAKDIRITSHQTPLPLGGGVGGGVHSVTMVFILDGYEKVLKIIRPLYPELRTTFI